MAVSSDKDNTRVSTKQPSISNLSKVITERWPWSSPLTETFVKVVVVVVVDSGTTTLVEVFIGALKFPFTKPYKRQSLYNLLRNNCNQKMIHLWLYKCSTTTILGHIHIVLNGVHGLLSEMAKIITLNFSACSHYMTNKSNLTEALSVLGDETLNSENNPFRNLRLFEKCIQLIFLEQHPEKSSFRIMCLQGNLYPVI